MKKIMMFAALALHLAGCSSSTHEPVDDHRIDRWAEETGASEAEQEVVRGLLSTATRGHQIAQGIEDPIERRRATQRWKRAMALAVKTQPRARELFVEAQLVEED